MPALGDAMARLLALVLCAIAIPAVGQGTPALHSKVEAVAVTPRVFYVQGASGIATSDNEGFISNAGFVVTNDGVVVIDALGTLALGDALLRAIRKVTSKPVKRVILTHYHADHFYGLKPLKDAGAEVWAHRGALEYLDGGEGARRLAQRAKDLFPWVDERMEFVRADQWLDGDTSFKMGGTRFDVYWFGPAHSPEDLVVVVPSEGVIFSGDLFFSGRIPFVGDADSRAWLERIDRLIAMKPRLMVPGHGVVSRDPAKDLALTRDYLRFLRSAMGKAVEEFVPFEDAYRRTDWGRFEKVPAFEAANRINAYGTYLLMERESLAK